MTRAHKNPNLLGWWYPAIADWMLANPGGKIYECARELSRTPRTISAITNSDLFREYLAQRRKEWEARQDYGLRQKVHAVAEAGLDIMLETLEKKRDAIPFSKISEVTVSALDRLGYSPNNTTTNVQVNAGAGGQAQVVLSPVSVGMLEEARATIRLVEQRRSAEPSKPLGADGMLRVSGAKPDSTQPQEDEDDPLTISAE